MSFYRRKGELDIKKEPFPNRRQLILLRLSSASRSVKLKFTSSVNKAHSGHYICTIGMKEYNLLQSWSYQFTNEHPASGCEHALNRTYYQLELLMLLVHIELFVITYAFDPIVYLIIITHRRTLHLDLISHYIRLSVFLGEVIKSEVLVATFPCSQIQEVQISCYTIHGYFRIIVQSLVAQLLIV